MKPTVLTMEDIRTIAPSVFADHPAPTVSSRYAYIPTASVVERMAQEGWAVRTAQESRVRLDDHRGYQRHMLRFAQVEDIDRINSLMQTKGWIDRSNPLAETLEVVLSNAHDGTASYQLNAGLFRLVCSNGLIISTAEFGCIRVRHTGDPQAIVDAAYEILGYVPEIRSRMDEMKQIELTKPQRDAFALAGASLKYGFDDPEDCPIDHTGLLIPRREVDGDQTLWTTYNVVQENLMKGHQSIRKPAVSSWEDGSHQYIRPTRTRATTAVDATLRINKGLWILAEELRKHCN